MTEGARTPEELETLLEDAFVTRDAEALSRMFVEDAALVVAERPGAARGAEEIGRLATALWDAGRTYVAAPRRVLQAGACALVLAEGTISVLRRGRDGAWRYEIALLQVDPDPRKEKP